MIHSLSGWPGLRKPSSWGKGEGVEVTGRAWGNLFHFLLYTPVCGVSGVRVSMH